MHPVRELWYDGAAVWWIHRPRSGLRLHQVFQVGTHGNRNHTTTWWALNRNTQSLMSSFDWLTSTDRLLGLQLWWINNALILFSSTCFLHMLRTSKTSPFLVPIYPWVTSTHMRAIEHHFTFDNHAHFIFTSWWLKAFHVMCNFIDYKTNAPARNASYKLFHCRL